MMTVIVVLFQDLTLFAIPPASSGCITSFKELPALRTRNGPLRKWFIFFIFYSLTHVDYKIKTKMCFRYHVAWTIRYVYRLMAARSGPLETVTMENWVMEMPPAHWTLPRLRLSRGRISRRHCVGLSSLWLWPGTGRCSLGDKVCWLLDDDYRVFHELCPSFMMV